MTLLTLTLGCSMTNLGMPDPAAPPVDSGVTDTADTG